MWQDEGPVDILSEEEAWTRLGENSFARLALAVRGEVDIFPLNYHSDGSTLLMRTAPGTKLLELTINDRVALEIDGYTDDEAWSVVVKGNARRLQLQSEIAEADEAPLTPWIPTLKYEYVRITPTSVSGRHFRRGPEPERY